MPLYLSCCLFTSANVKLRRKITTKIKKKKKRRIRKKEREINDACIRWPGVDCCSGLFLLIVIFFEKLIVVFFTTLAICIVLFTGVGIIVFKVYDKAASV